MRLEQHPERGVDSALPANGAERSTPLLQSDGGTDIEPQTRSEAFSKDLADASRGRRENY
ncbi:hypothetical protein CG471_13570 [Sphingobium sp. IP1]|nr:hypothetical protein CG471_13570 [Sphingobium sp. IP1]